MIIKQIESVLESVYQDKVSLVNYKFDSNNLNIYGSFYSNGDSYDYTIYPQNQITYLETNDSAIYLASYSLNSYKADAVKTKRKCLQGKPCGNTCIVRGVRCRASLNPQASQVARQIRQYFENNPDISKFKSETKIEKNKNIVNSNAVLVGATALTATSAFIIGASVLKEDEEGTKLAIAQLWQNTLEESGMRTKIPQMTNTIEGLIKTGNNKNYDRDIAKSLAATIKLASKDKKRLNYINKLTSDLLRREDFKYSLNLFARDKKIPPYPEEAAAIRYYTDTIGYKEINMTLRGQHEQLKDWVHNQTWRLGDKRTSEQIQKDARQDIEILNQGLSRLPDFKGKVYRGLTLPDDLIATLEPGKKWDEVGFTSTTKNSFTTYPGNVAMVIESKRGKDITKYEKHKNDEVLFKNNTSFTVKSKRKVKKFGQEFYLVKMVEN